MNQLLFPLKPPENQWLFDNFMGNGSQLIYLILLKIRSKIWQRSISWVIIKDFE